MKGVRVLATLACFGPALSSVSPAAAMPGFGQLHVAAPRVVTVRLQPVGHSRVTGTVRLSTAGARTKAVLDVRHLPPGANAFPVIHAGRCSDPAHLSASSLFLPSIKADAQGRAMGTGWMHGPDAGGRNRNVRLSWITGGHDVIVIYTRTRLVACGDIP